MERYTLLLLMMGPIPDGRYERSEDKNDNLENRFTFGIEKPNKISDEAKNLFGLNTIANINESQDTNKGFLNDANGKRIMEFLFYRKNTGKDEATFFNKVKEIFYKEYKIDTSAKPEIISEKVIEAIKSIRSATKIKEIFKKAYKDLDPKKSLLSQSSLINLNTTALCMLHRNLQNFYRLEESYAIKYPPTYCKLTQKIGSYEHDLDFHDYWRYRYWHESDKITFPNVLLTSDSFLKTEKDVDALFTKYQHYKNNFWLFQIPHHGSKKNSDQNFLGRVPLNRWNFINYGINNTDNHPDSEVINDMITTGHHRNLIPVNQFQGLSFGLQL